MLAETAARQKVATQMGNAGHSSEGTRRVVELIRAGAIGPVREVHAWTNRPIWPQGVDLPADRPPVPSTLNWDLWLGPAPERPYHPAYHPFKWRGWWDFGTGALGDMGCHIIDAAFWALDLRIAQEHRGREPPVHLHPETAPAWSIVRYEFPARGKPAAGHAHLVRRRQAAAAWSCSMAIRPPRAPAAASSWARRAACSFSSRAGRASSCFPSATSPASSRPSPPCRARSATMPSGSRPARPASPPGPALITRARSPRLVLLGNVALRAGRKIEWDAAEHEADERVD